MRFLHIADLHLGKQMNDVSLLPDQEYMLEQIASLWPNATLAEDAYTISASEDIREQAADFTAWIERQ